MKDHKAEDACTVTSSTMASLSGTSFSIYIARGEPIMGSRKRSSLSWVSLREREEGIRGTETVSGDGVLLGRGWLIFVSVWIRVFLGGGVFAGGG